MLVNLMKSINRFIGYATALILLDMNLAEIKYHAMYVVLSGFQKPLFCSKTSSSYRTLSIETKHQLYYI